MPPNYTNVAFITGTDGRPLKLLHGTCRDFDRFSRDELRSAGVHFGCEAQANHTAGDREGARIIPVFLKSERVVDLRGSDYGWLHPNMTLFGLQITGVLPPQEIIRLAGAERRSSVEAFRADLAIAHDREKCRQLNREIEDSLAAHGVDCVIYSNRNEPPDGEQRDAYFVLFPEQIYSAITGERFE
jgi:ADP-Ribosyltransferase in polyvalent proteins